MDDKLSFTTLFLKVIEMTELQFFACCPDLIGSEIVQPTRLRVLL